MLFAEHVHTTHFKSNYTIRILYICN